MKEITALSNLIQKYTSTRSIILMLILFILITGTMEFSPIGSVSLRSINNGAGMLDMQHEGYSAVQVYLMFDRIGEAGRYLYAKLLGLDVIFAIIFMLLQSLLITNLIRRLGVTNQLRVLNLLPVVRSVLDLFENCLILVLIFNYPVKLPFVIEVSSTITILKWVVYSVIIVLTTSLGVLTAIKPTLNRGLKALRKIS